MWSASRNSARRRSAASGEVGCGPGELAGEKRGVDEAEKESPPSAPEHGLVESLADGGLVASRRLLERVENIGAFG